MKLSALTLLLASLAVSGFAIAGCAADTSAEDAESEDSSVTQDELTSRAAQFVGNFEWKGADSLAFLSIDGLYDAVGGVKRNALAPQFTDHYFTGDYPTTLTDLNGRNKKVDPRTGAVMREAS